MVQTISQVLKDKTIVITRPKKQASNFAAILRSHGARVLSCPTIRICPLKNLQRLDAALKNLDSYNWLIFTSANGVEQWMKRYRKILNNRQLPKKIKTCAIGPATAEKMLDLGIPVTKKSKEYVAESILKEIPFPKGKKILIPRAMEAREVLPKELERRGAQVEVVPVYSTVLDGSGFQQVRSALKKNEVDCITFTSSSTVRNFFALLDTADKERLRKNNKIVAASIGPVTTLTLMEFGWHPEIVAKKPTTIHLARAIVDFYRKGNG